jgi:hypothetical protein
VLVHPARRPHLLRLAIAQDGDRIAQRHRPELVVPWSRCRRRRSRRRSARTLASRLPSGWSSRKTLLKNTHDGSGAVTACATPVRVVCMNTLRAAVSRAQATYEIRHTSGAQSRLAEAPRVLGLTRGAAERVRERAEELTAMRISDGDWRAFLQQLVRDPPDSRTGQTRAANVRGEINRIYHGDRFGQDDVDGTAWGAWQAVVAYNDHAMTSRRSRTSTPAETRYRALRPALCALPGPPAASGAPSASPPCGERPLISG